MPVLVDPNAPPSFMQQLQDGQPLSEPPVASDDAGFDLSDLAAKNRNRGNYRCSKVSARWWSVSELALFV